MRRWLYDNQMDVFIENLFLILNVTDTYEEAFNQVRKCAIEAVRLKPTVDYRRLNPVYPKFELPCSSCCTVNENPGPC